VPHGLLESHLDVVPCDPGLLGELADGGLYGASGGDGELPGLDLLPGGAFEGFDILSALKSGDSLFRRLGRSPGCRVPAS
jgi:hypothetical protein